MITVQQHRFWLCLILVFHLAFATPTRRQGSVSSLSSVQVSSFGPFARYASAAYCSASSTLTWTCGEDCSANPSFIPVASGGNGDSEQWWYVGYDPTLDTVIVGHQGTNPKEILPLLTDADLAPAPLSSSLFPSISPNVMVHSGFRDAQAMSASDVLSAVQSALGQHGATQVTMVGHSLGAAIALLDAVYLPLHLPEVTCKAILYGLPRVGNQAFADYVDAHVTSMNHINNKKDPIPTMPGMFMGYRHPSGEIHVDQSNNWMACPGQDNPSTECEVGAVPNVFESDESDHDGPYDGVVMGC
ncbi:uncharacterized protein PHACADRAFT_130581 [Phanerochaete carnosa HHB-10118-sp]|uniref:Fungal lipase-type domain-containing protein n=1 Tax=Phanerochaete carnosa (strain HHB-10118-sp) TaxID=650164 RepID=K5UKB4_PHACS|nr:uncharacterized protein PHACADRAFT_130581 [Phanerochaete carnosa HHB-10118-sp]EKM50051.1 hypothetical protein PHACADRAFT_130581 [Phanerochaete carnosa HHB-10118-sp]